MNKFALTLITLGLIVASCSPAAQAPTNAPVNTNLPEAGETTTAPAITQQAGTFALPSQTPAATGQGQAATVSVATVGGPVVLTVEPANGTPKAQGSPPPAVLVTPIPTLKSGLSPAELKYRVLAAYPDLFYCDPDMYPVAVGDESQLAEQAFPQIQANTSEFQAILAHTNLAGAASFTPDQKLVIYRAHKMLAAIRFELTGDQYQFQLETKDASGKGLLITGLIDGQGSLGAQQSQPTAATCPV